MKRLILIAAICSIIAPAIAGSSSGQVDAMTAHAGDAVMFAAGTHSGAPACSTVGNEWTFSLNTSTGKAMYALLLSAQAQGKTVSVIGDGTCSVWPDRETAHRISIGSAL